MTSPGDISIRRATPSDADTVLTMVREIAAHQDELEYVTITVNRWEQLLARPEVIVLLAERDSRAVGYVSAVRRMHLWSGRDVIGLDDLFVRDGARDAGIGRRLMAELAALAAPEQLTISWGVGSDNIAAHRFYARLGAVLRTKVVVSWPPERYAEVLPAALRGGSDGVTV